MSEVRWWRVGVVRMLALLILAGGMHGIATSLMEHRWWDIKDMSMPSSVALVLIAIALFVIGYRSELAYEKTKALDPPGRHHRGDGGDSLHHSARQGH